MSGERPIELQMIAVVFSPMSEGFGIVASWQHDPTIRMMVKMIRKYQAELLVIPWCNASQRARKRQGR
jgi:hypothetical protein